MVMSSDHLAAELSKEATLESFRKSPFKFAKVKVPQGTAPGYFQTLSPVKGGAQGETPGKPFNFKLPMSNHLLQLLGLTAYVHMRMVIVEYILLVAAGKVTNLYYEYIKLNQAISKGDLQAVKDFLNDRPDAIDAWINFYETPLLKACSCGKADIVKELLRRMTPEQTLPKIGFNATYHTPLTVVAMSGNIEIAEALIAKNSRLPEIPGNNGEIPVVVATGNAQKEMAHYLYSRTPIAVLLDQEGYHGTVLFLNAIFYEMPDIALDLFEIRSNLAVSKHPQIESIPIIVLASKPDLFRGGCSLGLWQNFIYSCINVKLPTCLEASHSKKDQSTLLGKLLRYLYEWSGVDKLHKLTVLHLQAKNLLHGIAEETLAFGLRERSETVDEALLSAVRYGNVDFLVEMIKNNSELLWSVQTSSRITLFLLAVEFRQEKIFSLLYGMDDRKCLLLKDQGSEGNGILHFAGHAPYVNPSGIFGAAQLMQREMQWFKEVESMVQKIERERINVKGQTPIEIFEKEHESLRKEAEKWMKDTATSCSVLAALIITVTFAAIFTVPGGTDDKSGQPRHLKDKQFTVFVVSTLIACFTSCISVLIFLGILTARYSFNDFLMSLPTKMIAGQSILFVSIVAMLVAFSSALFTMLNQSSWIVIPLILLAGIPALLFVRLQYPILKGMIVTISFAYGKGIFDRNTKCWL